MNEEFSPGRSPARQAPPKSDDYVSRWMFGAGLALLLVSAALLFTRVFAFEPTLALVARIVSPDGIVTPAARDSLSAFLLACAAVSAICGALVIAAAFPPRRRALLALVTWDALRIRGLAVPNALAVFTCATSVGVFATLLWLVRGRLSDEFTLLFIKEGPFEQLTFVLELIAAGLCCAAALRWRLRGTRSMREVPVLYGACALVLFFVAMEEINWGQTLFGFGTPAAWAEVNYQAETSLHNLVDRELLNAATRGVAIAFGAGLMLLIGLAVRAPRSLAGAIAPPASLVGLGAIAAFAGLRLHPELNELLLAAFFTFYGYRIYVAASSTSRVHETVAEDAEPDVPLAAAEAGRSTWDTELLEYTHDAIIIWEMGGRGIQYWNRAAEQLYGYNRHEAHGRMTHELLQTELAGGVRQLEAKLARFGVWVGELRHTTSDGRRVDVQGRLALLSQKNGRWLVLEVNRDITDRKAAEVVRQSAVHQLCEVRRLRASIRSTRGPSQV